MFGNKILEERQSKYNGNLKVVRSFGLGTYIQASGLAPIKSGLTQSGGVVDSMWRQTLKNVNAKKINAKSILILGLGGGTVVKYIKKYFPKAKITGVDIDSVIVELGIKYLKLDTSKVKIIIGDASNIPNLPNFPSHKFDLIIVDLYNGDKFPKKFETKNYIHLVRKNLARSGVAVFNRLYFKKKKEEALKFGDKLRNVFPVVEKFRPIVNLMYICKI